MTSALDWSMEGRGDIGHAVIDLAPEHGEPECYTGWFARQLGMDDHHHYQVDHWLRPLLDKMATAGVLVKSGGQYRCPGGDGPPCYGRMHQEACYYRLALDRTAARERWEEHIARPRWWALTPRAASTGPSFAELAAGQRQAEMRERLAQVGLPVYGSGPCRVP